MRATMLRELADRYGAHNYKPLDVIIQRAKGIWVWDTEGKRYLDCLSAYSALNQGHCHPRIINALVEQAQKLTLTSRAFRNDQLPLLCKEICQLTGYGTFLPMNTGAEAVETAMKTARKWAYSRNGVPHDQAEIIVCENNFHGRTITIVTCSTQPLYRDGFGPFTPGFEIIPYGDARALEEAMTPHTAGFLVEPIQGEGGVIVPPEGYLAKVREVCTRHDVLMMADEIQTGLGRTGKFFACDHEGVRPDVMIVGKALGGGVYPVSGVLSSEEILEVLEPGTHGSTFGGNPLGAAVAREALKVLVADGLIENAAVMGEYFVGHLKEELEGNDRVREVRGKGLLVGIELHLQVGGARQFCEELALRGLLCKETHRDVIRFAPPLLIDREATDWAMLQIVQVLNQPLSQLRKLP